MQTMTVGFAGLGAMGAEMALQLFKKSRGTESGSDVATDIGAVVLWNRTTSKAHAVKGRMEEEAGGAGGPAVAVAVAEELRQFARTPMDAVCFMLADDPATEAVLAEFLHRDASFRGLLVNCATVSAGLVGRLTAAAEATGGRVHFANCAVTGRPEHARRGLLCSWVGARGEAAAGAARAVAERWSKKVAVVSMEDPAASARFKLATNMMVYGVAQLLGEELLLLDKAGIDRSMLLEWVEGTCKGTLVDTYARKMLSREFGGAEGPVGASLAVGAKDLRLIAELGGGLGPAAAAAQRNVEQQAARVASAGGRPEDREWCSFLEAMEAAAAP